MNRIKPLLFTALLLAPALLHGATASDTIVALNPVAPVEGWHAQTLGGALGLTALFGLTGIVLAFIGYKIFDKLTPGDMHKEIFDNKNIAAAIVAAAVILGVSLIIAASIMG